MNQWIASILYPSHTGGQARESVETTDAPAAL